MRDLAYLDFRPELILLVVVPKASPRPVVFERITSPVLSLLTTKNNPYSPAGTVFPSTVASCENLMVVFSLAPARHGASALLPNAWAFHP
jgi:hypothetical protein